MGTMNFASKYEDHNWRQYEMMLAVYGTIISRQNAIYCSGPLTSGRRAIEWYRRHPECERNIDALSRELREDFERVVVQENVRVFKHFVLQIRENTREVVIDPSALEGGNWSQGQWLEFWCDVIANYVQTVVLTPDWQYSKGSSVECLVALHQRKNVELHDGSPVDYAYAVEQIQNAGRELEENRFKNHHFENVSALAVQYLNV
jgi:hypothetical protein